jgi:hypothetical protein
MTAFTSPELAATPAMPEVPIERLTIWRGSDFKDPNDFTHRLTDAETIEIDTAVQAVAERKIAYTAIDKHNFELPQLGKYFAQACDNILKGLGFMVLRGLPVERYSIEQTAAAFLGIGAYFGKPVSQNGKGHILGHVMDLGRSIDDPSARIYQTTRRQTFHTDSVDIVALLCLKTAKTGGLSRIVSSMLLYAEMARRRPDLAAVLFEPFCFDRRARCRPARKATTKRQFSIGMPITSRPCMATDTISNQRSASPRCLA